MDSCAELQGCSVVFCIYAVERLYNEVLGTMEIALLYRVSPCIRIKKKKKNMGSWGRQGNLVMGGVLVYPTSL